MDKVNKAAAAGVIFFMVILAGFVGIKVDQTTIALLGGAFIGLVIAIPTTALIMIIGLRKPDDGQVQAPPQYQPPAQPQYWNAQPPQITNHYHDHKYVVVVEAPYGTPPCEQRFVVSRELRVSPIEAQRMIDAGAVKLLSKGE